MGLIVGVFVALLVLVGVMVDVLVGSGTWVDVIVGVGSKVVTGVLSGLDVEVVPLFSSSSIPGIVPFFFCSK